MKLTITLFLSVLSFSCLVADDAANTRQDVWQKYLSSEEQTSISSMMQEMMADEQAAEGEQKQVAPEQMIAMARKGFEEFTRKWALPIQGIKTEEYDEKGIKGVWFRPEGADKERVLLYFHGGGFVVGSPKTAASITGFLAKEAGIECFSLDYPLSPEVQYPAALNNAVSAYRMLLEKGYKHGHIVLGGDSAGGGLALATLLKIREAKLPMPAGAYLISPWSDLTLSFPSHQLKADVDVVLGEGFLEMLLQAYVGGEGTKDPFMSPAFADLKGVCPLLIQVGSHEKLLDDSLTVARNAALADVPVRLSVWPGYSHDFQMYTTKLEGSRKALKEAAGFLKQVMDKTLLRDVEAK